MERLNKINNEIELLERELEEVKGREAEVYTRIVGYYRAVKNWNKGKREEYNHRICFTSLEHSGEQYVSEEKAEAKESSVVVPFEKGNMEGITGYYYFYRKTCPNCPSVKKYISNLQMPGEAIDVDTPEGISAAAENGVMSVPTVIFHNANGKEVSRARNVKEIKDIMPASCEVAAVV